MTKSDLGGVWRTVGGRRIFIKDGQDLESAMKESGKFGNKKINDDKEIKEENQAIHYGDLGKGRDTYFFAMNSSNRSTGHFGTGVYFLSKEASAENEKSASFSRSGRPKNIVDFSEYNLYKPKYGTKAEAEILFEGLKSINNDDYKSNWQFDMFKKEMIRNNVDERKINDALNLVEKTRKEYIEKGFDNKSDANVDSLSTVFMKKIGFNGIDVRGIKGYDNTEHGSVIYDINKKIKKVKK